MSQLGSMNGPSNLETLVDVRTKQRSPVNGRKPEKPDSTFADLVNRPEVKAPNSKEVPDRTGRGTEKSEKSEKTERADKAIEVKTEAEANEETGSKEAQSVQKNDPGQAVTRPSGTKREKAMLEFMDSMESELGIPPQEIVAAMAQMKLSDFVKPPEDTAEQVIENLDLTPEGAERALALYTAFLHQSKTGAPTDQPTVESMFNIPNRPNMGKSDLVSKDVLSGAEKTLESKQQLNQSLDVMNKKFFMQDRELGVKEAPAKMPFLTEMEMEALEETRSSSAAAPLPAVDLKAQAKSAKTDGKAALGPEAFFQLGFLKAQMGEGGKAGQGKADLPQASQPEVTQMIQPDQMMMAAEKGADSGSESASKEFFSSSNFTKPEEGLATQSDSAPLKDFSSTLGLTQAVDVKSEMKHGVMGPDRQANVDKLADQAQMIVYKGGGEAIVKLNPEGLGEVRLKVMVQDGKVSLEMATETKEAKKLIESSLGDLKNSLASHKLSIDQVRVDVGNQTQSDSQSQKNMDARSDLNQGRQFMGQFREEMSGRRDSFIEMPGIKAYQARRKGPDPLTAAPEVATKSRSTGPGRGERMNLIA